MSTLQVGPVQISLDDNRINLRITGRRGEEDTEKAFADLKKFIETAKSNDLMINVMECRTLDRQGREADAISLYLIKN